MSEPLPRILCVDDEENILKALVRNLRRRYDVTTATGGREALALMAAADEPFAVIVSDMRMPEMNGVMFLEEAQKIHPDSTRILLTGYAELQSVIASINKGRIFRFLSKPCPVEALLAAIRDALRQYHLLSTERVLLEQTLTGSIRAMADMLAVANPAAFGHADRVRQLALNLAKQSKVEVLWPVEVAAMLAQLGCITLPPDTATRFYRGETLTLREQEMVARIPVVTCQILGNIPRLEAVLELLAPEDPDPAARARAAERAHAEQLQKSRAILRLASDVERLRAVGWSAARIRDWLRTNKSRYDEALLHLYEEIAAPDEGAEPVRGVTVREMQVGMTLVEDVKTETGLLLVAAGQEVTLGLLEKINNFHDASGLQEPLWVRNPALDDAAAAAEPAAPVLV
ncbi:MAG TPA: response regulator [Candidatus Krumholzibacteria bacterium]|nr:response regulator [Candidatus Krumholzibacteria bacterium]